MAIAFAAFNARAAEALPAPETGESFPIEPPLLISRRTPDGSPIASGALEKSGPDDGDLERLETVLIRAKKNAGSAERMFKAGIISKVDAEERVLRVIRLEAKIAAARVEKLKRDSEQAAPASPDSIISAEEAATRATEAQHRAELDAALRNLQRQQKLLALGSARQADVNRAQEKLTELQRPPN